MSTVSKVVRFALKPRHRTPVHVILHITSICNARCGTCFAWKSLNKPENEINLDDVRHISENLGELIWLHFSGGEPTLSKNLAEACEIFSRNNKPATISIPTNCLKPKSIRKVVEDILGRIDCELVMNLSLDGLGEVHDKIRGVPGNFERFLETYAELAELRETQSKLSLKVATVINSANFDHIDETADFVRTKMPAVDFHTLILMRGDNPDKSLTLPNWDELQEYKKKMLGIWSHYQNRRYSPLLNKRLAFAVYKFLLDTNLDTIRERRQVIPCQAWQTHLVIDPHGNVSFCELREPFGNVKKTPLPELLASEKAEKIRKSIQAGECHCTHGCNQMDNILLNPRNYPRLLKNFVTGPTNGNGHGNGNGNGH